MNHFKYHCGACQKFYKSFIIYGGGRQSLDDVGKKGSTAVGILVVFVDSLFIDDIFDAKCALNTNISFIISVLKQKHDSKKATQYYS